MHIELIQKIESLNFFYEKSQSVLFVAKESDIDVLYSLLCEQDSAWLKLKHLIKLRPQRATISDLDDMCQYANKATIKDIDSIKSKVDFFIYTKGIECDISQ